MGGRNLDIPGKLLWRCPNALVESKPIETMTIEFMHIEITHRGQNKKNRKENDDRREKKSDGEGKWFCEVKRSMKREG